MENRTIKAIKKKLTGDKENDIKTLQAYKTKYKNNEEIVKEINSLLRSLKREIKKENINNKEKKISVKDFTNYLINAKNLLDKKEANEALIILNEGQEKLNPIFDEVKKNKGNSNVVLTFFFSLMECSLFEKYYPEKDRYILALPYDYVSLLSLKGQAYVILGDFKTAMSCFLDARKFNPTNVDIQFMVADLNYREMNHYSFLNDLDRIYNFIYKDKDFIKYYKSLYNFYQNYNNNEELIDTLFILSDTKQKKSIKDKFNSLTDRQKELLDENNIHYNLSSLVESTCIEEMKNYIVEEKPDFYNYFYSSILPFKSDKEIEALLKGNK